MESRNWGTRILPAFGFPVIVSARSVRLACQSTAVYTAITAERDNRSVWLFFRRRVATPVTTGFAAPLGSAAQAKAVGLWVEADVERFAAPRDTEGSPELTLILAIDLDGVFLGCKHGVKEIAELNNVAPDGAPVA